MVVLVVVMGWMERARALIGKLVVVEMVIAAAAARIQAMPTTAQSISGHVTNGQRTHPPRGNCHMTPKPKPPLSQTADSGAPSPPPPARAEVYSQ